MVKCSAPLCCNSTYNKTPEISFHRFPKNDHLKNSWLLNMNKRNWQPKSSNVICSKHFEAHLVDNSGFRSVLARDAIPTIFDLCLRHNILLKSPKKEDIVLDHVQNLQSSTSSVIPNNNILLRIPKKEDIVLDHEPNLQSSTSSVILNNNILLRIPKKEDIVLDHEPNLQSSTSSVILNNNILLRIPKKEDIVLDHEPNLQSSTSSVILNNNILLKSPKKEDIVLDHVQNLQSSTSSVIPNNNILLRIPKKEDIVLDHEPNLQSSTSSVILNNNILLKSPKKEDIVLDHVQNLQSSTSSVIPNNNILLKSPKKEDIVLDHVQNLQSSTSSVIPNNNILLKSPKKEDIVLDHVQNLQSSNSSVILNNNMKNESLGQTIKRKITALRDLVLHDIENAVSPVPESKIIVKDTSSLPEISATPLSTATVPSRPETVTVKPGSAPAASHYSIYGETLNAKLKRRILYKNRKIKRLHERNRRMRKTVQRFSVIIKELRTKLNEKAMISLSNIPISNKKIMVML